MAATLEQMVKQLEDSGVVAAGKLKECLPPRATPKDAEELVKELVKQKHLTPFQAQHVSAGKTKSLILGAYTILDKIGAGGMGQVFKALHRRMDRVVAIKMLPPSMTKDAAATARFEREVRAAAKLEHTNIVTAYDADQANGVHFLVMQYVEGRDLSALVKKDGPFPVAKAVNYILQAARGLEYAHKHGVVHRDIKPANLLLNSEGTIKILDMGLARLDASLGGDSGPQDELTGTGTIMGTVDYMAPEQALNTKHADHRADIYSLGITLYYLIAGKAPYKGDTVMEKLLAHREAPIPSLRNVQPDVSDQVQDIFRKMVAKKLDDRYQSMSEVVVDLEASSAGQSQSFTVQQSRTSTIDAAALTFLKELPTPSTAHKPKTTATAKATKAAAEGVSKSKKPLWIGAGAVGFLALLLGAIVLLKNNSPRSTLVGEGLRRAQPSGPGMSGQKPLANAPPVALRKPASPVEETRPNTLSNSAFQTWLKDVAALPAEKQAAEVGKKLQSLNPGFDGKFTFKLERGAVTEFEFLSDNVSDISPVRALSGLKTLSCRSSEAHTGRIFDLSPLKGLKLSTLYLSGTLVSDLSPLEGMPLKTLFFSSTQVSNLSPLKGIQLKNISCASTPVSDLAALSGMPLTSLNCREAPVKDLSPLENCQSLASVLATHTQVTAAGVAALQKALPSCKIEWDGAATPTAPAAAASTTTNVAAPVDVDRRAAVWVLSKGGTVGVLVPAINGGLLLLEVSDVAKLPKSFRLSTIRCGKVTTEDINSQMSVLAGLKHLTSLSLLGFHTLSDEGLKSVAGLKQLTTLMTNHGGVQPGITDEGVKMLSGLTELTSLALSASSVTDACLPEILKHRKLNAVYLSCSGITDVGVKQLVELPELTECSLQGNGITDRAAEYLASVPMLKSCNLYVTAISPDGFAKLATGNVERLYLTGDVVTDASVAQLAASKSLVHLQLGRTTKVTPAGVAAFQKANPACTIEMDPAPGKK